MNCSSCGAYLSSEDVFCPVCGVQTPYSNAGTGGVAPTVSSVPSYPSTPYNSPPLPSMGNASPLYGASPSAPNADAVPPPPLANPYGSVTPIPAYGPSLQQTSYGGSFVQPGYATQTPPQRGRRVGLIIGIVALVVVLGCAGVFAIFYGIGKIFSVPTTSSSSASAPSGKTIDPVAAAIITNAQSSSAIDNNFSPTKLTSTFTANETVYVTFGISSNGKDGYIEIKWYINKQLVSTRQFHHSASNDVGYASSSFTDTGAGATELYWCAKTDCSDEQLADVVTFNVNVASVHPVSQPIAALLDIYSKEV